MSQSVCPFNSKFAQELKVPAFRAREVLASNEARAIARALLAMSQAEFSAAFKGSPMKRVKRRGLARNAAVALGNVGTAEDVAALEAALRHDEPLVHEHAAWALARLSTIGRASYRVRPAIRLRRAAPALSARDAAER